MGCLHSQLKRAFVQGKALRRENWVRLWAWLLQGGQPRDSRGPPRIGLAGVSGRMEGVARVDHLLLLLVCGGDAQEGRGEIGDGRALAGGNEGMPRICV